MSGPEEGGMSPDNIVNVSLEVENYGPIESTLPAVNTFTVIQSDNEWLKRYLSDGYNSHIGNVPNEIEVTMEDGEKWYRLRIPYLCRFYNTEVYLVGQQNDFIYTLRSKEKRWCV